MMDLALTIFYVGVGIGALLVGIGVLLVAFSLRPVARDARSLANDARRLVRLAEAELPALLAEPEEPSPAGDERRPNVEELPPGRPTVGPVQSANAREDERIA